MKIEPSKRKAARAYNADVIPTPRPHLAAEPKPHKPGETIPEFLRGLPVWVARP